MTTHRKQTILRQRDPENAGLLDEIS